MVYIYIYLYSNIFYDQDRLDNTKGLRDLEREDNENKI